MTANCAAESAISSEPSCLTNKPGTYRDVSPSGQGGSGGRAVLLRRASNRSGRRLSSGTTSDSHPPLLSALEERKLAERIKAGDQLAQQELVLANRKLVYRIVRNYPTSGISAEDLVQEGSVGLIRAAQNFDPATHAIRFSYYATFWIRAFIQRAVSNNSSVVRLPEYTRVARERYLRAARELREKNDAETRSRAQESPSQAEIAQHLGISLRQLERAWLVLGEQALGIGQDEPATDLETAEDDLLKDEERALVHAALRRLSPFEAWLIRERFGLGEWSSNPIDASDSSRKAAAPIAADQARSGPHAPSAQAAPPSVSYYGRSYDKLSQDCGLSVHRIRLIERTALGKLRSLLSPAVASDL
ncbi:MAG: sigma-70 family RNA polymerase sigma factor [Isosphaeraceae bacterium]